MNKLIPAIRKFLWSLMGTIPPDFDGLARDAVQRVKPEEDGDELLSTLALLVAIALLIFILLAMGANQ